MENTALYIANLRLYVGGEIHGRWFTLPVSPHAVFDYLRLDGSDEYGEEWIILDAENPYGLPIHEYSDISKLNHYVLQLDELDETVLKNLSSILSNGSETLEEILENSGDNYHFTYESSMEDVAREFIESCGGVEEAIGADQIEYYFDFEKLGRDMKLNGCYFEGNDGHLIEYIG